MAKRKTGKPATRRGKKKAAAPKPERRQPRLLRRRQPEPEAVGAVPVEARALARYVRLAPQKARLVIDLIRGQQAGDALNVLRFTKKRAARPIEKVLRSAIANAEQKSESLDVDRLYVKHAVVNEGSRWKRLRAAPHGRAFLYQHRTCHIEIRVAEQARAGAVPSPAPAASEATT